MPQKTNFFLNRNSNDFCFHFGFQNPSQKVMPLDLFSIFSPRHVQDAPRRVQDALKPLQDTSKTPLRPPKTPPRRLWTAQRRLQAASSCPETPQECYKIEGFEKSVNFLVFFIRFFLIFHVFRLSMERKRTDPFE